LVINFDTPVAGAPASQPPNGPITNSPGAAYTIACTPAVPVTNSPVTTYSVNPNLFEIGTAGNTIVSPGQWMVPSYQSAIMTLEGPGANGTPWAAHVHGCLEDLGNGVYPSIELAGALDATPPAFSVPPGQKSAYNMSFFSGIKFYMNIASDDTAKARYFYVNTTQESPSSANGTCAAASGCYNYFGYTFPGQTTGWQAFSFNWSQLTVQSYGFQPTPSTLSGVNLEEVLQLIWEESNSNTNFTANIDFWVDEVYFY
jgi:hypothetical protein